MVTALLSGEVKQQIETISRQVSQYNMVGLQTLSSLSMTHVDDANTLIGRANGIGLIEVYSSLDYSTKCKLAQRGIMLFTPRLHDLDLLRKIVANQENGDINAQIDEIVRALIIAKD